MNLKPLVDRLSRLEAVRQVHVREEIPSLDTSVLSQDQRDYVTEAARMIMKIRRGELEWTDDRVALAQDALQLLDSCPKMTRRPVSSS